MITPDLDQQRTAQKYINFDKQKINFLIPEEEVGWQ